MVGTSIDIRVQIEVDKLTGINQALQSLIQADEALTRDLISGEQYEQVELLANRVLESLTK